jgi:aminopeptidase YwaD
MIARLRHVLAGATALALALAACRNAGTDIPLEALTVPARVQPLDVEHAGPNVMAAASGPARFARQLYDDFDAGYARELLEFIDGYYRAPANDGYEAVLERVEADLRAAGFGSEEGLELSFLERPLEHFVWGERERRLAVPAWTPVSASVTLVPTRGAPRVLHQFDERHETDRTMLPVNSPAGSAEGSVALDLESVKPGQVLVIRSMPRPSVLRRAVEDGAVAVVSANLESYNVDPTDAARHQDAVQYARVTFGTPIPVCMISPRSYAAIEAAAADDPDLRLRVESAVRFDERPLRTLVAVVRGSDRSSQAFAIASHVQEPGANDNATGVAGLAESARSLARLLRDGKIERPSRSLVFLWGDEFRQTLAWLEATDLQPVGGLSSDMTGASFVETGAICLLERMPDPGALRALAPDEHTPWGQAEVDPTSIRPNGIAVVARCALADVGLLEAGWKTSEHPYEGGSDHDIFISHGLPTALIWHFTDFTYHTSLDRLPMVDVDEMRRTAAVILSTALSVADPKPADLDRYLQSLDMERDVRVEAAEAAEDQALAQQWRDWCDGARHWFRVECLRIPESEQ